MTDGIKIIPRRDASIYIDGRRYSGEIDIKRRSNDAIVAINIVDLERYIKGVLYHEVSHRWPIETLKAQAVAARTYALYRMQVNKDADYDVTSDIYSQVYGGKSSERYRTNIAVNRTKDLVMTYNGKILPAYYHATCGGMTENAGALWEHAIPPLRGVRCPFCRQSPHFQWKKNFRLKDIQDKLNARGYDIGLIKTIEVIERNPSGRITTLRITARDGKTITIAGKDFRDIIGPNIIKSNNYEVVMQGYYMDLLGKGWGHGVGMCQWGAYFMAQQRYRYDAILQYYYPGMAITDYHRLNLD